MELNKENLIQDLCNLISIPSYNDESNVAGYIITELEKIGLNPEKDAHGNVILCLGEGDGFLLNAHMDTVDIKGWEDTALKPIFKKNRVYGRGSSDTKSGIATMLEIARKMKDIKLKRKIIFLFSVKEEDSKLNENGAFLAYSKLKATEGIILEPTFKDKMLEIGVGCKGAYRYNIIINGKSCHSCSPNNGINPIYLANDFINSIRNLKLKSKSYKLANKEIELKPVISVTQINAKEGTNVVPGRCTISIDYRALPDENEEEVKSIILKLCSKHFHNGFDIEEYSIKGYFDYDKKLLDIIKCIAEKNGYLPNFIIKQGKNDAAIFSNYGKVKSMCFGTGESGEAHTLNESVLIDGFLDCSEIIYLIIKNICT
jgi:acetylornithine deacetylase/succinyl-diaminopimelate desuccinylase-like protein